MPSHTVFPNHPQWFFGTIHYVTAHGFLTLAHLWFLITILHTFVSGFLKPGRLYGFLEPFATSPPAVFLHQHIRGS